MSRFLVWTGRILGLLIGLLLIAFLAVYLTSEKRLNQVYSIEMNNVAIPSDTASIERGNHIATTIGFCTECHGQNFSGQVFDDGPLVGVLTVSNLTKGKGGVGRFYSDQDWIRAIRHGVGRNGKSLMGMPSNYFYYLSNEDLGALIAYLKTLPAFDNEMPKTKIGPMARLFVLTDPSILPAQVIQHTAPRPAAPPPAVNVQYGEYLAHSCKICHGDNLAGGNEAGSGINITPGGAIASWSYEDFSQLVRTGVKPNGQAVDPDTMPWRVVGQMSDSELKAIWVYLQSLPPVEDPTGG